MTRTALVHLVRHANGPEPFETFMASYERHPATLEHDLVLLFKGFGNASERAPYLERAAAHVPHVVEVSDDGFDLTAYFVAATTLEHERLCFLNSFSEILAAGWLGLLGAALDERGVGAAGATGSWNSHLSYRLYLLGLGGAYARSFPSRRAATVVMHELSATPVPGAVAGWLHTLQQTVLRSRGMTLFPAMHLRTNAVLVERALLLSLRSGRARTKWATYELESGRRSITRQLIARGRPPVMVDRHGVARAPPDWHLGDVFCQSRQQDLIVGDNQTRRYASATRDQRALLSAQAWGVHARPG
ncbi:MAG: hypothetical protein QOG94_1977 [Solirubrobacteraceae bacterium]|jgi:hypothetical protein|nr:hypothetical protein [Solirubrobacteraceae bacterium]